MIYVLLFILFPIVCQIFLKFFKGYFIVRNIKGLSNGIDGKTFIHTVKNYIFQPRRSITLSFLANTNEIKKRVGDIFYLFVGAEPVAVVLTSSKKISTVFSSLMNKSNPYDLMAELIGDGIVSCNPNEWKKRRYLIIPLLKANVIKKYYLEIFNRRCAALLEKLKQDYVGKTVEISELIMNHNYATAWEIFTGPDDTPDAEEKTLEMISLIYKGKAIIKVAAVGRYMWMESLARIFLAVTGKSRFLKESINSIEQFIQRKRALVAKQQNFSYAADENFKPLMKVLHEVTETNPLYTERNFLDDMRTMWAAAGDSQAAGASYTLLMLAMYPDIQAKVHDELHEIFTGSTRPVTADDLEKMCYLEQCIKESLRLIPPAPTIMRETHETVHIDGITIPPKTNIYAVLHTALRDENVFSSPEIFDPDRFSPQEEAKRPGYSNVVFGWKPRNCIGNQYAMISMKINLSTILRNFSVTTKMKMEDIRYEFVFVIENFQNEIQLHPLSSIK